MQLELFSKRNRLRCTLPNGFNHNLSDWSLSDWLVAVTGELGEAANVLKKLNRIRDGIPGNGDITKEELQTALGEEIADTFIYLDLFSQANGFDLATLVSDKFMKTSRKIGYVEVI